MNCTHKPNTKTARIVEHFLAHPDDRLTWEQMVEKFDLGTVRRAQGLFEYIRTRSKDIELETVSVIRVKAQEGMR